MRRGEGKEERGKGKGKKGVVPIVRIVPILSLSVIPPLYNIFVLSLPLLCPCCSTEFVLSQSLSQLYPRIFPFNVHKHFILYFQSIRLFPAHHRRRMQTEGMTEVIASIFSPNFIPILLRHVQMESNK